MENYYDDPTVSPFRRKFAPVFRDDTTLHEIESLSTPESMVEMSEEASTTNEEDKKRENSRFCLPSKPAIHEGTCQNTLLR